MCSADHEHHVFWCSPCAGCVQHFFPKWLARVFQPTTLEIIAAPVGGECQYDSPFAGISKEWRYTVLAHVRGYGDGIAAKAREKGFRVHPAGVPDVAPFGVSDDKVLVANVFYGIGECFPSTLPKGFVKGKIGLVGYAQVTGGINDLFVKCQYRVAVG